MGRMDLMDGRQLCAGQHRLDRTTAVLGDQIWVVAAAIADVEAPHFASRNSAPPAEEAMRRGQKLGTKDLDYVHSASRMMMSSSACSPTMKW